MPSPAPKPKPKPKGKGSLLTRRFGPFPVWAWLLAAIAAFLVYRAFISRSAAASGQSTTPPTTDATGTLPTEPPIGGGSGGGGGSLGGGGTTDNSGSFQAYSDMLAQLGQQNASLLDALLTKQSNDSIAAMGAGAGPAPVSSSPAGTVLAGHAPETVSGPLRTTPIAEAAPVASASFYWHPVAATTPSFGQVAQAQTAAARTAGAPAPFGGVTSVRTLANGATLTTYASGRQVEQVPGKSAYVVHA